MIASVRTSNAGILIAAGLCAAAAAGAAAQGRPAATPKPGFFSLLTHRQAMPLPPELQGDVRVIKVGALSTPKRPIRIPPYAVTGMKRGVDRGDGVRFYVERLGYEVDRHAQQFSFRLAAEDAEDAPLFEARCAWALGTRQLTWTGGDSAAALGLSQAKYLVCELSDVPDADPWVLAVATDIRLKGLGFGRSAEGELLCGNDWYEARSTFVAEPSMVALPNPTGTVFLRDGRARAAVERVGSGRIILDRGAAPEEQHLLVAASAALLILDRATFMVH